MIAIVYPQFYGVGGIARYLDSFLANLPENAPPIYLITGDENKIPRQYKGVEIIHIPFSSNRFSLISWSISAAKLVKKLYADKNISLVNFHFPPLIPGLFLPRDIPIVLTAHTTYRGMSGKFYKTEHFKSPWNALALTIKFAMENIIFSKTSKVISLTEQGRQEVLTYGVKKPIAVIPNGVDISQFVPDASVSKDIDVLFCGRIEKRKGSRPMVEVCERLVIAKPDINIYVVGYGDDDQYVKQHLSKFAGNITLTGKVPFNDMMSYYSRSKLYVSTSYYEGLPGTCLEAMAMHLPAIVWDFQFYEGLVIEGKTGFLATPNDYDGMVQRVLIGLDKPEEMIAMGAHARSLLEAHYSWAKLSDDLIKVILS
ncbi:MAG: glycosyltransferase family 4 protein [Methylophilaceae bacterium]